MYSFEKICQREFDRFGISYPDEINEIRARFFKNIRSEEKEQFYYSLGGAVCSPVFTYFCEWAVHIAEKEGIKLIFPLMREGQLYSKLLNAFISLSGLDMKVNPIYVSRRSSYNALCYDKFDREFFRQIAFYYPASIRTCFHKLGIDSHKDIFEKNEENIDALIREKKYEAVDNIYNSIIERKLDSQINERINNSKMLLHEYLLQNGATENFMTLDYGSLGTIPQAIDNCSSKELKKIHLFLAAYPPVLERIARGHDIRYLLDNFDKKSCMTDLFFSGFANYFFETITMGNTMTGTAAGYEKDPDSRIRVLFEPVTYSHKVQKAVELIQNGILDFCVQYINHRNESKKDYLTEQMLECGIASFCRLIDNPLIEEVNTLGWFEYDDSACSASVRFISPMDEEGNFTPLPLPENEFDVSSRGVSSWKQGSYLLNSELRKQNYFDPNCRNVVVYGCGYWGRTVIDQLHNYNTNIICIVDKKLAGESYLSYPIVSIDQLLSYDFEDIIIASVDFADEIYTILETFAAEYSGKFKIHKIVI